MSFVTIRFITTLLFLASVAFVQNMVFTLGSRSRNSGNPKRHFKAALGSNGVWFICNFFILFPEVFKAVESGNIAMKIILMVVYVIATASGSSFMMRINLGFYKDSGNKILKFLHTYFAESGYSKVGSKK